MLQFKTCNFFVFVIDLIKRFTCLYSKAVFKSLIVFIYILKANNLNAQTDTTIVDTVSMAKIDSLTKPGNDEYIDTTVKHIYDTSQYFFNWKDNYSQPYTTTKIAHQHLIDEDVKRLKHEDDFWYVPAIEKIETRLKTDAAFRDSLLKAGKHAVTDNNRQNFTQQAWFHFFVWFVIAGIFLGAIIYFLLQNKISLFSKEAASSFHDEEKDAHENIFRLSYNEYIKKAEAANNYRVAIRLMFLQTLKLLSDTNHIKYRADYTNIDYLRQLHQSHLYNDFSKVMRSYEYAWYGKFDVSAKGYAALKQDFLMLQNKIT